jgi:hypothetical protein
MYDCQWHSPWNGSQAFGERLRRRTGMVAEIDVERRIIQALVLTTALKLPLMALNRVCTPLERPTSLSHANNVRSLAALFRGSPEKAEHYVSSSPISYVEWVRAPVLVTVSQCRAVAGLMADCARNRRAVLFHHQCHHRFRPLSRPPSASPRHSNDRQGTWRQRVA